eukprot:m.48059 g.48059  ORF g.48059 m.48059 type:complete len:508 (-) comp20657_c0_seq1:8-1531(-)
MANVDDHHRSKRPFWVLMMIKCVRFLIWAYNTTMLSAYRLFGYNLPPTPNMDCIWKWHSEHGMFQNHRLTANFFNWLDSPIVSNYIPTRGVHIFIKDVVLVEKVLTDKELFPTRGWTGFMAWVPQGLLSLPTGPRWKLHRTLVSKSLSTMYLQQYSSTIASKGAVLVKYWKSKDGAEVDVQSDLSRCTLDIISSIAFGIDLDTLNDPTSRYGAAADTILKETALQSMQPAILKWFPFGRQRKFQNELAWIRQKLTEQGVIGKGSESAGTTGSVLRLLRTAQAENVDGVNLTDEEVIQEVLTVGGAGHETTGNTMSWCLLLLAQHPEVQTKLRAEVRGLVEADFPTFEEARQLNFCRCCVYETLRLFPTVPLFPRVCARDCKLGEYDVPAGARVIISQMALNRNPQHYTDPDEFVPARFLQHQSDPKTSKPVGAPNGGPAFAFCPFGAGARTCIGQRLAVLEAIQLIGGIVKNCEVRVAADADVVREHSSITLRPRGLKLSFHDVGGG